VSGEIKTQRLAGHIGAEIAGVDLSGDVSDDAVATLRSAVLEHHVIFLRDQFLGPERLRAMGKRFGDLLVNPLAPSVAGLPEVVELVNRDGGAPDVWHFDSSFLEAPPALSLLSMVTTPSVGGDTLWMSGYAALEALAPTSPSCTTRPRLLKGSPGTSLNTHLLRRIPRRADPPSSSIRATRRKSSSWNARRAMPFLRSCECT